MRLGTKVLVGVLAGIVCGIFLGEYAAPFAVAGDVYVDLLQMTVLPFVTVSLIQKVGSLRLEMARALAGRAGLLMLLLWAISLATVVVMPLGLPDWQAGTFFSTSLIEEPERLDFVGLFIPKNPFHSLANNVVPAVVLFSIFLGGSLIGIKNKSVLLEPLGVIASGLGHISAFIVRLSPIGTFALTAGAAGRLEPSALIRLAGYVSTYTLAAAALGVIVLPGLVAALTPFGFRRVFASVQGSALTAFATGKLFAVLPVIMADVKQLLIRSGVSERDAESSAELYVPLGYPFPNAGKLLILLFIPFAGWYIGRPLEWSDTPLLLGAGLFATFGSPLAAIPFLLGLYRLPVDMFPLFLVAGIWCARVGDALGAVHLALFSVLCSAWNANTLRVRLPALGIWFGYSVAAVGLALLLNRALVRESLGDEPGTRNLVARMTLARELVRIESDAIASANPAPIEQGETRMQRILRVGELRVGYVPFNPPFSYVNESGDAVGFDVDMVQQLANELKVDLRLIPTAREAIAQGLEQDFFDLAVGGIPSSIQSVDRYRESIPYISLHAALLVPDRLVSKYRDMESLLDHAAEGGFKIGWEKDGLYVRTQRYPASLQALEISSAAAFIDGQTEVDALLTTAETGAVLTMLNPEFSVVVPEGVHIRVPIVVAYKDSREFEHLVSGWIHRERENGALEMLYEHWILGQQKGPSTPRWSVIRDLLGWVN